MSEETSLVNKPAEDIVAQLRQGSGEATGESLPFIPLLMVDNTKEMKDVEGREVEVLCAPRYKRTDKVGEEYQTSVIESFTGVVLVMKWIVYNKGKWDDATKSYVDNGAPFFASRYFDPVVLFGHKEFSIKYVDGTIENLTYPELKRKFEGKFKLEALWFVKVGDELVRVKFRGSSRSAVFDFIKALKSGDSISAHKTLFAAKYESKPQPHNISTLAFNDEDATPVDWTAIVEQQKAINEVFNTGVVADDTSDNSYEPVEVAEGVVMEGKIIDPDTIPFK